MPSFIVVDASGKIYGSMQCISAAYGAGNLSEGQKLVETERLIPEPSAYVFDWDTREIRRLPSSGAGIIIEDQQTSGE